MSRQTAHPSQITTEINNLSKKYKLHSIGDSDRIKAFLQELKERVIAIKMEHDTETHSCECGISCVAISLETTPKNCRLID